MIEAPQDYKDAGDISHVWEAVFFMGENIKQLQEDLEKMRVGYMTLLSKLSTQEGIIAQMQLELNSYRNAQMRVNNEETRNTKHENFAFRVLPESAPEESAVDTKTRNPQVQFSTSVKMKQVIEYHNMYADKTQFEVAKHFNITIRTLQNYLRRAGVTWKQVGE